MRRLLLASLVTLVPLAACGRKADIVIEGGPVWTGLSTGRGQPGAVAIADGKIPRSAIPHKSRATWAPIPLCCTPPAVS